MLSASLPFRNCLRTPLTRCLDTSKLLIRKSSGSYSPPLELQYEKVDAPQPSSNSHNDGPLVICHGLFGSKQNWRSLSKAFATRLNTDIYSLDLRNHGASPHHAKMDYATMAADVLHFCESQKLTNISLLGHSMGGKVAMAFALNQELPSGILSKLIVADVAPSSGALSPEFRSYTDAMLKVEQLQVRTRKEANDILQEVEKDTSIRAFLLTNLLPSSAGAPLKFRVPVDVIKRSLEDIGAFPYTPGDVEWKGDVLVIKGEKSNYINKNNIPMIHQFFPNVRMETLDAAHWVHAEKPREFVDFVVEFVKGMSPRTQV